MEQGGGGSDPPRRRRVALERTCAACGVRAPAGKRVCPGCGASVASARWKREAEKEADGFGPERAALDKGVAGGLLLIVIAIVWFVAGWNAGRIFFYPPVLAVIGLYGVVKGLSTGNLSGRVRPARREREADRGVEDD